MTSTYKLDNVPQINNGYERPCPPYSRDIVPQANGLHFVIGDYSQEHHGESVTLFDGDTRIDGCFISLPNKPSESDPSVTRGHAIMQEMLDRYASEQKG